MNAGQGPGQARFVPGQARFVPGQARFIPGQGVLNSIAEHKVGGASLSA